MSGKVEPVILKSISRSLTKLRSRFDLSQQEMWDAAHLAVQSAVAAVAAFVLMRAFGLGETFVAVLSAVLVIQPSVGNTLVEAGDRVLATVVGSVAGVICLFMLPYGYGTAIALAITMLVINAIAGLRPNWLYGVVAGVALALGSEQHAMETAQERAIGIAFGAFVGVGVSLLVWPDTASRRASRQVNTALRVAARMLDKLMAKGDQPTAEGRKEAQAHAKQLRARFETALGAARQAADGIRLADGHSIRNRIEQVQRLFQSLILLERVLRARREADISGNETLGSAIEDVRSSASKALMSLVDEGRLPDKQLSDVVDHVEGAKETPRTDDRVASMLDNAFVFALSELALSLRNLQRAFDEHYEGSMLDWGADAHDAVHEQIDRMASW